MQCPPGTYTVKTSSDGVMAIVSADNATKVLFLGQRAQCQVSDDASLLVFNCYGDTRYLSQIRPSNETSFLKLRRSPEEATLARQWAERQETVAAAATKKP
jgi:hypothetical protein